MDVNLTGKLARLGGAVLSLAVMGAPAKADDASMVVVMASDQEPAVGPDAVAELSDDPPEPSELVVHVSDDAPPAAERALQAPAARGELTVVANGGADAPVAAPIIADPEVRQAGSIEGVEGSRYHPFNWNRMLGPGARRPAPIARGQMQRREPSRSALARNAVARNDSPPTAVRQPRDEAPPAYETDPSEETEQLVEPESMASGVPADSVAAAMESIKSPGGHARQLLVDAYQLSLTASNESEYSQIVQWCVSAQRVELDAESRQFAASLSAWALNRRGQLRADEGQSQLGEADFRAAIECAPNNWRALHNRAVTYAQNGQFAEAFDDFCRVIQLNPKFAKAYSNRGTLYVQAGDVDRALADYDAALALDPSLLQALVGRGRVCHMQGKLDEALECLDAAVQGAPEDADIVCSRADLLTDLGRYEDALLDYAQAIDLNSKFEHAYRNGAWLLATCPDDSIRDVEGALAGAQAALECGYGDRHAALDTLAAALANAGRFEEAVGTVQQAIDVAPEDARTAYVARQHLYESRQPFRTQPIGVAMEAATAVVEPTDDAQTAVYVEE